MKILPKTIILCAALGARLAFGQHGGSDDWTADRSWVDRQEYVDVAIQEQDYPAWGASPVIRPEGTTRLFVSRWPIAVGFGGWLTHCEIARYESDSPAGPFVFKDVVVTGTGGGSWDHHSPQNPNVQRVGDRYALGYIANRGGEGKARVGTQQIGMMTADHPAGPWRIVGEDGLRHSPPSDPRIWSHWSEGHHHD